MKILVAIPVLYHGHIFDECVQSVLNNTILKGVDVDLLIGDNGSPADVKAVIQKYWTNPRMKIIIEPTNIYVNPIWNKFMQFFLANDEYDYLIIMNSDLILQKNWAEVCKNYWEVFPDEILIPKVAQDRNLLLRDENTSVTPAQEVHAGTAGVFITLNRKQCQMVYPIPEEILVWFGDQWIYEILRTKYKTVIPENLIAYHFHGGSQTVGTTNGISQIIEDDKANWAHIVNPLKLKKIEQWK